jgi:hypothetical protein
MSSQQEEKFEIHLGEVLLKGGLLSPTQLAQAMWEKAESGLRLEEICLEHNWVAPENLYSLIPSHMLRLGGILILNGYLEVQQLQQVLSEQKKKPGFRLGELLIQKGLLRREFLEKVIREQEELRRLAYPNSWELFQQRHLTQSSASIRENSYQIRPPSSYLTNSRSGQVYSQPLRSGITQAEKTSDPLLTLHYQKKIADLECQLQEQQEEWERFYQESTQQISTYQMEYEQQILKLQLQLELHSQQDLRRTDTENTLRQTIVRLEQKVTQLEEENNQLKNQTEFISEQAKQDKSTLEKLREELKRAEKQLEAQEESIQEVAERLTKAQSARARLINDLAETRRINTELQEISTQQEAKIAEQQKQILYLQKQVTSLETLSQDPKVSDRPETHPRLPDLSFDKGPWKPRLLQLLHLTQLITDDDLERILVAWDKTNEPLTTVVCKCTSLNPETVSFFQGEGHSARLQGADTLGSYLIAAGLVTQTQLDRAQQEVTATHTLCQVLVKQGILNPALASYFQQSFG